MLQIEREKEDYLLSELSFITKEGYVSERDCSCSIVAWLQV